MHTKWRPGKSFAQILSRIEAKVAVVEAVDIVDSGCCTTVLAGCHSMVPACTHPSTHSTHMHIMYTGTAGFDRRVLQSWRSCISNVLLQERYPYLYVVSVVTSVCDTLVLITYFHPIWWLQLQVQKRKNQVEVVEALMPLPNHHCTSFGYQTAWSPTLVSVSSLFV